MVRKLTNAIDDDFSLILQSALLDGYRLMAEDAEGEAEAAEWVEALSVDTVSDSE